MRKLNKGKCDHIYKTSRTDLKILGDWKSGSRGPSCFGRDRGNYCWRGKVVSVTVAMTVVIIVGVEGDLCGPWV